MGVLCPNCGEETSAGCTCELPKASDGHTCCWSCISKYEREIEHTKPKTASNSTIKDNPFVGGFGIVTDTN